MQRAVPWYTLLTILLSLAAAMPGRGQTFSFVTDHTELTDTLGHEVVFDGSCTNLSTNPITLRFVRTLNDLPPHWESSMCLDVCFPPTTDTILTSPLQPAEVRPFSLHVYPLVEQGTGYVRVLAMNSRNLSDTIGILYTTTAITDVEDVSPHIPLTFSLGQNYPNPWNPSTRIRYALPARAHVHLEVFDILGRPVAQLVDAVQEAGHHEAELRSSDISPAPSSGIYFYRFVSGAFTQTRKMILAR